MCITYCPLQSTCFELWVVSCTSVLLSPRFGGSGRAASIDGSGIWEASAVAHTVPAHTAVILTSSGIPSVLQWLWVCQGLCGASEIPPVCIPYREKDTKEKVAESALLLCIISWDLPVNVWAQHPPLLWELSPAGRADGDGRAGLLRGGDIQHPLSSNGSLIVKWIFPLGPQGETGLQWDNSLDTSGKGDGQGDLDVTNALIKCSLL